MSTLFIIITFLRFLEIVAYLKRNRLAVLIDTLQISDCAGHYSAISCVHKNVIENITENNVLFAIAMDACQFLESCLMIQLPLLEAESMDYG